MFKLCSGKVHLADDKTLDIAGVGDVVLKNSFGTSWTLKDVRYIPGLKKRLISVGQLDEEGYHVGFEDQQWKVTKGSLVVACGNKRGSLYMVEVPSDGINATIDGRGNAALWHQRLGHMSEKGMKILASKGRIPDLQKAVVGFCEPCVLGKQKKVSFVKSGNTRKLQRLELVHTDVYGPTSVASIGGSRYYVTFIDDNSRKVWVYFLKNKSEVFNTFKKWKAAVENETNLRVKCLKSDNGGEYSSRDFIGYYAENWIRMLKTVSETPQQNGVAERMNRTLDERAKRFRIPEEEWQGKEVSLAHLRVFGCDSYVEVKDVARDKLDAKSVKCTFIGYGSDEMGYRFWDSKSHKVVRSRDVTFNEDSLYGAKAETDSSNLTKPNKKDQAVLEDSPENLANKSIVTEHGLSSKITQSLVGSSDASEGEAPRLHSYEDPPESPGLRKEFIQWKKAINEGMVSLEKNQTWSLVRLPAGKKALQSKWVFRVKEKQDGSKRHKARLVVKGFQQKRGVDYNEIFSPVVKITTIRLVFSIVAAKDLHLEQLDVKTAFLHGDLDEDIYMTQPEGFQSARKEENLVCKLKKSLYGLKQAPRQWYLKFDSSDMAEIKKLKRQLSQEFEMKELGPAKQILGMSIIRDKTKGTLRLSQEKYIGKVLEKFNMKDAKARCQPLRDHFKLSKIQASKTEASRRRIAKVPYASAFMSNPGRKILGTKSLAEMLPGGVKEKDALYRTEVCIEVCAGAIYPNRAPLGVFIANRKLHTKTLKFHSLKPKATGDKEAKPKTKSVICTDCDGNGAVQCSQCKGNGVNTEDFFNGQFKVGDSCWLCGGKKEMLCGNCNGAGFVGGFMSGFDH
ncbi:retrovirus-related pol polyprotein from transposon TNT 1-94 [Tanacetum coccineum]